VKKQLAMGFGLAAVLATAATASAATPGTQTGPSSTKPPVLVRTQPGIVTTSILTTGDQVGGYTMAGIPDGLGAYDNGDGTFTVVMNHEIPAGQGLAHGGLGKGAFVSKWVIDSDTLEVLAGSDLIQTYYAWDAMAGEWTATPAGSVSLTRLCSADLPDVSAFYDAATGLGTMDRIFMNGEESGTEGRAIGSVVTGAEAGNAYELPSLGKFAWENSVAKPGYGTNTAVVGLDDGTGGQVYVYIGEKSDQGNAVEKAGLADGELYGLKIEGIGATSSTGEASVDPNGAFSARFSLVPLGDVTTTTGVQLDAASVAAGVSSMARPEDGSWDPSNPANFYFNTTASFSTNSRLWKLTFDDPMDLLAGGTASVAMTTAEDGAHMLDNLTVNDRGQVIALEDVGNNAYLGGVYQYDPATDRSARIAQHDPALFTPGAPGFITQDEEASGVIPVPFLGAGKYLIDSQIHKLTGDPATVEMGQLLLLHIPPGKPVR
jgi:hypothetical protein